MKKIRMMIGLLLICCGGWSFAQENDLFVLQWRLPPALEQADTETALRQAVALELKRLTGRATLPEHVVAFFTEKPTRWIERFSFSPWLEDGVPVGRRLEVRFDRKTMLRAMQEKGLRYWPQAARPRLLAAALQLEGRKAMPLTEERLRQRPDMDFLPIFRQLGVMVKLAEASSPLYIEPVMNEETAQTLMRQAGVDGILRLTLGERYRDRQKIVTLDWEWIEQNGKLHTGHLDDSGVQPRRLVERMLQRLMESWRRQGKDSGEGIEIDASLQGEALIEIQHPTVARMLAFEDFLARADDQIVQQVMTELTSDAAVYRVRYLGSWQALLQRLQRLPGVVSVEPDAENRRIRLLFAADGQAS